MLAFALTGGVVASASAARSDEPPLHAVHPLRFGGCAPLRGSPQPSRIWARLRRARAYSIECPYRGDPPSDVAEILCDAVRACDLAWVRHILDAGCDPNAVDTRLGADDAPALIDAASAGHCVLIRVLIDAGANVNARSGSGWTALMRACNAGRLEAARMLLDAGADPTFVNDEGYSAYGRIPGNHCELLALLVARGGARR